MSHNCSMIIVVKIRSATFYVEIAHNEFYNLQMNDYCNILIRYNLFRGYIELCTYDNIIPWIIYIGSLLSCGWVYNKIYTQFRAVIKRSIFLPNPHKRHPIARPQGRVMGCLLWVQPLIKFCSGRFSAINNITFFRLSYNSIYTYIWT